MSRTNNNNRFDPLAAQLERADNKTSSKPGMVKLADAMKLVREDGSVEMDKIPDTPAVAKRKTVRATQKHEKFTSIRPIPESLDGKYRTALTQAINGRPSESAVRALFFGPHVKNFEPVATPVRDKLDPHYKEGAGKANLVSILHSPKMVSQSLSIFAKLGTGNESLNTPDGLNRIREWLEEAKHYIVADGPMESCLVRFAASAGKQKPRGDYFLAPETVEAVINMLPFRPEFVRNMRAKMPTEFDWVVFNLKSGSGFPWDQKKEKVLGQALSLACQIFNAIRDGTMLDIVRSRPQLMLVKLMNKLDRYDSRELLTMPKEGAVRQYFVYGFHWTILFACVNQNITSAMQGFWENPASFSAHGFSWQEGGPQRIVDWIRASRNKPGLHGIAYSDDQLWVVRCADGSVWILCLDIRRMDLNLVGAVGGLYFKYGSKILGDNVDKSWLEVFRLMCKNAFSCPVLLEHSIVALSTEVLHSGATGTAEFDQVASAAGFKLMKDTMGAPENLEDAKKRLDQGLKLWKARLGWEVKPYEFHSWTYDDKDPEDEYVTPWTFLGKKLNYSVAAGGWLPMSDPVRCFASLIAPKSRQDGVSGLRGQMQRVRQIVASGGFAIPEVYPLVADWYKTMLQLGNTPADPWEPSEHDGVETSSMDYELELKFPTNELPSWHDLANIYLPPGRKVNTQCATIVPAGKVDGAMSATDLADKVYGTAVSDNWADMSIRPEASYEDKGSAPIPNPTVINSQFTGRAAPKTAEELAKIKKARAEKLRNAFQLIADRGPSKKPTAKLAKGTKLANAVAHIVEEIKYETAETSADGAVPTYESQAFEKYVTYDEEFEDLDSWRDEDLYDEMSTGISARYYKQGTW